ncbi:response regulator [Phenylobacterium sp. VNQ135]|uniref:response regulator n=1 Tax=Phenylobacterium sp. VNQ135 TaxID=3400922 RepID=UPI003C0982B1
MDLRRIRVLLVEDNREMGTIVRAVLASWGCTNVRTAETIKAALDWLDQESFDLMVVDRKLPDGDGFALVRQLRRSPLAFLPVLVLTGHASAKAVAEARDSGVNEFLAKPFTARRLYDRLHRLIYQARGFVTCDSYVGPDRRRRMDLEYKGPERRRS